MRVSLDGWDWAFLVWSLVVTTGVGLYYARRAGANLSEYLLSGRNLPWWALGTSMVATTFAADTPIVVAEFVITKGIAGNWLWWNFLVGGTLTVFVFSRLWRRSGVVTEVELIAKRYDGRAALALRGFKALYLGLLVNAIIFGWVTKAMSQILDVVIGPEDSTLALSILIALTLGYTALSGLWGVVATDILQFAMAMIGSILMAVLSVKEAGGLEQLVDRVSALGSENGRDLLAIFPTGWNAFSAAILVLVLVNWWAVYYPGAEPGGGGYVAQRMAAAKDEKHARAGTLWFAFAHYVLRPWPWILVGLAALALEPRFLDPKTYGDEFAPGKAYPSMFRVLPVGLLGLVVASFVAAYMSTITSQLNLAASYLVNDFYLPFVAPKGSPPDDRTQVRVARGTVVAVTIVGCVITWLLSSAGTGWTLIMEATAGSGLVLVLRWLWWRVNAWSEISAMAASAVACLLSHTKAGEALLLGLAGGDEAAELVAPLRLLFVVAVTTVTWLAVTFATKPVGAEKLAAFYREVRPGGFWGPVARALSLPPVRIGRDVALWAASSVFVFGCLFGIGELLLLRTGAGVGFLAAGVAGGVAVVGLLRGEASAATSPRRGLSR